MLRWTRPERNGSGLMTYLIEGFRQKGGEIATDMRSAAGPRVVASGPMAAMPTGEGVAIASKAVVVASGGHPISTGGRVQSRSENHKVLEGSGRGSNGSGHRLIREAGGYPPTWTTSGSTSMRRRTAATTQRRGLVFVRCPAISGQSAGRRWPMRRFGRQFRHSRADNAAMPGRSWIGR